MTVVAAAVIARAVWDPVAEGSEPDWKLAATRPNLSCSIVVPNSVDMRLRFEWRSRHNVGTTEGMYDR